MALTFVSPPGTAQFYLGQRRRAWLWAVAVPFGYATYVLLLVGVPLPWAYGSFVYFAVSFLLGWRVAALVDLFLVPSERFQRPGALKVCAFYAASLALSVGVLVLTRSYVAEAFKIPSLVKQGHPWLNGHEVPHCKVATARPPGAEASGDLEIEFLDGRAYLTYFEVERDAPAEEGPWLVPPSRAFVLGDNRHNSLDSRRFFEGRGGESRSRTSRGPRASFGSHLARRVTWRGSAWACRSTRSTCRRGWSLSILQCALA